MLKRAYDGGLLRSSDMKRAITCVHYRHCTKRYGPLVVDVAKGGAREAGDPCPVGGFCDHVVHCPVVHFGFAGRWPEVSDDYSRTALQRARQKQLPHHPVHAIDGLVDILENQDCVVEIHRPGSAHERCHQRQVAAGETARRTT